MLKVQFVHDEKNDSFPWVNASINVVYFLLSPVDKYSLEAPAKC